jgi:hypothetical protein
MVRPGRLKLNASEVDRRSRELLERLARLRKLDRRNEELAVSFQQIVHPVLTEETEVAEASDSEGKPDEHA